jgi:hypothetical protein
VDPLKRHSPSPVEQPPIAVAATEVHVDALLIRYTNFTPFVEVVSIPDKSVRVVKNVRFPSTYVVKSEYGMWLETGASGSDPPE